MTRKILYSPGFGAGWVSWAEKPEVKAYMLSYQPIIDFLEAGGRFTEADIHGATFGGEPTHPLLCQLIHEVREKFGEDHLYVGGARDLKVETVSGRVRIHEYDGSEHVEVEGEFSDWL